jgi:hypothetical protein
MFHYTLHHFKFRLLDRFLCLAIGKSFTALLYDRYGYFSEIKASKKDVESVMTQILLQCPWIVAGFTDDLKKLWDSRAAEFVAAVD